MLTYREGGGMEPFEIRSGDTTTRVLKGYVATYDQPTTVRGRQEIIRRGAFDKLVELVDQGKRNVFALWNHDRNKILGETAKKTLALRSDDKGLYAEIALPNDPWGDNAWSHANRTNLDGDTVSILGGSFGFAVRGATVQLIDQMRNLMDLTSTEEVTVTPYPAYMGTDIGTRSSEEDEFDWEAYDQELLAEAQVRELQPRIAALLGE